MIDQQTLIKYLISLLGNHSKSLCSGQLGEFINNFYGMNAKCISDIQI